MELFDNHCHLEDLGRKGNLEQELEESREAGITGWFSCALCREEYAWHLRHNIEGMVWSAGIHPFYEKSSAADFPFLVSLCESKEIAGIGEIGLDSRNSDDKWQIDILLQQLELARHFDLPVIFHVVKRYYELHKVLKANFPQVRGWLHGFNASQEVLEAFSGFDLGFSLNARLPHPQVVKNIIKRGLWQIETDAPYARSRKIIGEYNHLKHLILVKEEITQIIGTDLWI